MGTTTGSLHEPVSCRRRHRNPRSHFVWQALARGLFSQDLRVAHGQITGDAWQVIQPIEAPMTAQFSNNSSFSSDHLHLHLAWGEAQSQASATAGAAASESGGPQAGGFMAGGASGAQASTQSAAAAGPGGLGGLLGQMQRLVQALMKHLDRRSEQRGDGAKPSSPTAAGKPQEDHAGSEDASSAPSAGDPSSATASPAGPSTAGPSGALAGPNQPRSSAAGSAAGAAPTSGHANGQPNLHGPIVDLVRQLVQTLTRHFDHRPGSSAEPGSRPRSEPAPARLKDAQAQPDGSGDAQQAGAGSGPKAGRAQPQGSQSPGAAAGAAGGAAAGATAGASSSGTTQSPGGQA